MADVTPTQVATSLGRSLTPVETPQVAQWLNDAALLIKDRFERQSLTLDDLDQDNLAYVIREAVVLKVKRPDPASRSTVSIDDGTVTKEYNRDTGTIQILDEWWALLTPDKETQRGAFTIRPGGPRPSRTRCW